MPSDPKLQNIPASPRETLFRAVDFILRSDPTVNSIFDGTINSWRGDPKDKVPFAVGNKYALRISPHPTGEQWWAASEQKGNLVIDVEILAASYCWDDLDRIWYAIQRAFYPLDLAARNSIIARFQSATVGAWKGLMSFPMFAFDPDGPQDGVWRATGQIAIEYRVSLWS